MSTSSVYVSHVYLSCLSLMFTYLTFTWDVLTSLSPIMNISHVYIWNVYPHEFISSIPLMTTYHVNISCLSHDYLSRLPPNIEVRKKEMKTKQKNAQGVVFMVGASRIWKFVKPNLLRVHDVNLLGLSYDFSQVSSFVRSIAVCSATFRRDLLLQLLNPYHAISAVTALQATTQLDVACPICCVLRDEPLSIDRPVCPFLAWPASSCCCWLRPLYRCYTSSRRIIT